MRTPNQKSQRGWERQRKGEADADNVGFLQLLQTSFMMHCPMNIERHDHDLEQDISLPTVTSTASVLPGAGLT